MANTVNGDEQGFNVASSMIEAKSLSKYFGPFVAVNNISFAIPIYFFAIGFHCAV